METRARRPSSPAKADGVMLRRFCWRVVVFCAPLLGLGALFEIAMWRTGETWPAARVVDTQLRLAPTPSLYSRMLFSQRMHVYKYAMLKRRGPPIVIQGTSRVMQIREVMFHPLEQEFYNAGGMIQSPDDVATYAERIRRGDMPKPAVLIFGIDPWWVKEGDTHEGWLESPSLQDDVWRVAAHIQVARRLLLERPVFPWPAVLTGAPSPAPGDQYQAIGAAALLHGAGFRLDGSLQLDPAMVRDSMRDPRYKDRLQILQMVTEHRGFYTLPARVDPRRVTILLTALTALQQLDIDVYVFLPPFASAVQTVFETSPTWQPFWRWYHLELPARLRAAGLPCVPLAVPQHDGFDDRYMYDGHHPTEIYAAALVRQILDHAAPHSLLRTVDRASLDRLLARATPTPLAFEPPPPL